MAEPFSSPPTSPTFQKASTDVLSDQVMPATEPATKFTNAELARQVVEEYWRVKSERYKLHQDGPCVTNEELTRRREAKDRAIDKHPRKKLFNHQRWFTAEEYLFVLRAPKDEQRALWETLGALEPDELYSYCLLNVERPLGSNKFEILLQ